MSLKNFFYPDGIVPFPIPEKNEAGEPFKRWDGSTIYKSEWLSDTQGFLAPSESGSEAITVYGEGSGFGIKLTGAQVCELFWRWKQYKIDFSEPSPGYGTIATASLGGASAASLGFKPVNPLDAYSGYEFDRSGSAEPSFVCGAPPPEFAGEGDYQEEFPPDPIWENEWSGNLENFTAKDRGFQVQKRQQGVYVAGADETQFGAFANAMTTGGLRILGGLPVVPGSVIKTGPDEYWWSAPSLQFSYWAGANAYATDLATRGWASKWASVIKVFVLYGTGPAFQDYSYWEKQLQIPIDERPASLGGTYDNFWTRMPLGATDPWIPNPVTGAEFCSSVSCAAKVHFSDGQVAEGALWGIRYYPEEVKVGDEAAELSVEVAIDEIPCLELKPTKFFTYGGRYDETTGLLVP